MMLHRPYSRIHCGLRHFACRLIASAILLVVAAGRCGEANGQSDAEVFDPDFFTFLDEADVSPVENRSTVGVVEHPPLWQENLPRDLGDVPVPTSPPAGPITLTPEVQAWVRWAVLKELPPSYEDNRKWNKTEEVYDGFRFRREGWKVETYRKYKTVKQGTWSRYHVDWIEPERNLQLAISPIQIVDSRKLLFAADVAMPMRLMGRVARWQRDVQLFSLSVNADAAVALSVVCEVEVNIIPFTFPPRVELTPRVRSADIELRHFEVHRISQIGGRTAETLGSGLRKVLERKISGYEEKLVEKINRKLEKDHDRLQVKLQSQIDKIMQLVPGV